MKKKTTREILRAIFVGSRYSTLKNINDQARYLTVNFVFLFVTIPLAALGYTMIGVDRLRTIIDFGLAALILLCVILMRTRIPFKIFPLAIVPIYGAYCLYLLYQGSFNLWVAVWIFPFPPIAIFLCQMIPGIIQSIIMLAGIVLFMYTPLASINPETAVSIRFISGYILIVVLSMIYERISILKDKKEKRLNAELAHERDVVQTMKDNIKQGIFLMDRKLKILPQYSKQLISILSYYDSELAGKSFLDILASSLNAKQLGIMRGYFSMMFEKSKSAKILESANPVSEFEYKVDDQIKTLSTKFHLVEQQDAEAMIIGIVQDITREKEWEKELRIQKESQEQEMKNLFDVLQIDPLVFHDFIDDTETNFNYINAVLKDRDLNEKQVVTKFFQNVHAIKSNALILGLETFGRKLHVMEDDIKAVLNNDTVTLDDVLALAVKLETIMQEKDSYTKIINKVESFKVSNRVDAVLTQSLNKAVEKIAAENKKEVGIKAGQLDMEILESKLRKPIKDILFQCVRNSIYHGIEGGRERTAKKKTPRGLLVYSVKKVDGKAEVTFSDDGRGLDWKKIKAKYLETHPKNTEVNKQILLASIFSPEFSTAAETSHTAGRGIGLSLVKDLVRENHGSIKVDSSQSGLTFRFVFPLAV